MYVNVWNAWIKSMKSECKNFLLSKCIIYRWKLRHKWWNIIHIPCALSDVYVLCVCVRGIFIREMLFEKFFALSFCTKKRKTFCIWIEKFVQYSQFARCMTAIAEQWWQSCLCACVVLPSLKTKPILKGIS